ncbi:MAG TPA: hypothetical protein VFA74_19515 [Terriglobales bacterium]|nr:hypothetical protein [Terriglobales bacterium]
MTNGHGQNHHYDDNPEVGFERQDLSSFGVYAFFIAIIVGTALIALVLRGTLYIAQRYNQEHQIAVMSPLLPPRADTRSVFPEDIRQFPQPRLETDERTEIHDFRLKEEQELHSYGWVDQQSGVMRIPIERAMELIAQRGLPTAPATGTAPPAIVNMVKAAAAASDHSDMSQEPANQEPGKSQLESNQAKKPKGKK